MIRLKGLRLQFAGFAVSVDGIIRFAAIRFQCSAKHRLSISAFGFRQLREYAFAKRNIVRCVKPIQYAMQEWNAIYRCLIGIITFESSVPAL